MARIFHELLTTTFAQAFEVVVFAITDWSEEQRFIGPFRDAFARTYEARLAEGAVPK